MKISTVLRKAAGYVSSRSYKYSCVAIDRASLVNRTEAWPSFVFYNGLMSPCKSRYLTINDFGGGHDPDAREHRILALLMAAEVAESEGL